MEKSEEKSYSVETWREINWDGKMFREIRRIFC